jgi:hypothetical protein
MNVTGEWSGNQHNFLAELHVAVAAVVCMLVSRWWGFCHPLHHEEVCRIQQTVGQVVGKETRARKGLG